MNNFFTKNVSRVLDIHNKTLNSINVNFGVKCAHVHHRLRERNIDTTDFLNALNKIITSYSCQMMYYSSLDRPFYTFQFRTDNMIIIIGVNDGSLRKFVVRTVLDASKHNLYGNHKDKHIMSFTL